MASNQLLEQRLTALEEAVADLRKRLPEAGRSDWIGQIVGSITEPEAFDEVLKYGREFRQADRPATDSEPGE